MNKQHPNPFFSSIGNHGVTPSGKHKTIYTTVSSGNCMEKELISFFEKFIRSPSIFLNKTTLLSNYIPHSIPHRTDQVQQLASILAPTLKLERPSNIFVYGKTGTGKTVTVNFVVKQITDLSVQRSIPIRVFYVNCRLKKVADTEYRLLTQLIQELGKSVPITGLPTDEVYKIFFDAVEGEKQSLIIILDEIDQRIKSSLSEEEVIFPPYNALQLQQILSERAALAFRKEAVGEGLIEKCA